MTAAIDQHLLRADEKVVDHDPARAAVHLKAGGKVSLQGADDRPRGGRAILVRWEAEHGSRVAVYAGSRLVAEACQACWLA